MDRPDVEEFLKIANSYEMNLVFAESVAIPKMAAWIQKLEAEVSTSRNLLSLAFGLLHSKIEQIYKFIQGAESKQNHKLIAKVKKLEAENATLKAEIEAGKGGETE